MAILWEDLLHGGFRDVKQMLDEMYHELGSEAKVAAKLGVSKWAVSRKRYRLGLRKDPKFHNGNRRFAPA